MPTETTQHVQQSEEVSKRLERLEAAVQYMLRSFSLALPNYPWKTLWDALSLPPGPSLSGQVLKGIVFIPGPERGRTESAESPVVPWRHLVARHHPWRKQLYLKGRNMTVR